MNFFRSLATSFCLIVLGACASTEITEQQTYDGARLQKPERIIVYDFTADPGDVPSGSSLAAEFGATAPAMTAEQRDASQKLGAAIAAALVTHLQEAGLPALRAEGQAPPEVNDIVIRGYFVSLEEGNRAKRVVVGFGSGNSELHVAAEGYQQTPEGLRLLGSARITDEGSSTPGMVLPVAVLAATSSPIGLVVGGALKATGEVTGSATLEGGAERTAAEIAEQIEASAERQGWI